MKQESEKKAYQQYVKEITPKHSCFLNCLKAFFTGGVICTLGEWIRQYCISDLAMKEDTAASIVTISLIFLSVLLTGLNIYPKISKFGGAGGLVPITGFANSVAAPAIEYQKEGFVFGIGVKIFSIAGPVILYGVFSSFFLGILYMICKQLGVM